MQLNRPVQSPVAPSPSRNLVKLCSMGAAACCALIVLLIVIQAITGVILANGSRQLYPTDAAARQAAIDAFSTANAVHRIAGQLSLFPVLFLTAFSIIFSLHVGAFDAKHSKRPWVITIAAVVLTVMLIGVISQGVGFANNLAERNFWLTPPPGGYPAGTAIAKEQVVGSASFTTFITIHGIILPLLSVLLIIFVWPSFHEFLSEDGFGSRSKWKKL